MVGDLFQSSHPPHPPTQEDADLDWLRLLRSPRIGPVTFHRLLADHGSAQAALRALPELAKQKGVTTYDVCPEGTAMAELKAGRAKGARLVRFDQPQYPAALRELPDAPPILWITGTGTMTQPMIAIVGARNASSIGTRIAKTLATDLAQAGFVIVSGLARGIDTAAHLGALNHGTIAVGAGGVDTIYPAENQILGETIAKSGLRISEQPMGLPPQARNFPKRNRVIAGMAQAVIVVEATLKSGSMHTARFALDAGRDVMAVPGSPFDARADGCNALIREGAPLIRHATDVLEALGTPTPASARSTAPPPVTQQAQAQAPNLRKINNLHNQVLAKLGAAPVTEDSLIRELGIPPATLAPALTDLELNGRISRKPGGKLVLAH